MGKWLIQPEGALAQASSTVTGSRKSGQPRTPLLLLVACVFLWSVAPAAQAAVEPFTFVHISDTHIGTNGAEEKLKSALADIQRSFPEAEFIISTGDLTEHGYADQFTTYSRIVKTSPIPVHSTIGNHDSRWAENGKENHKAFIGPTWVAFDHKGIRFVLMDVAMIIEHYAHFDGQQMAMLKQELEALPPGKPAVICVHHPPMSDGRYYDNDFEFGDLIRKYNVPLVLDGHGHSFKRYEFNNTTFAMGASTAICPAAGAPSYRVFKVGTEQIDAVLRSVERDKTTTETAIPTQRAMDELGSLAERESGENGAGKRVFGIDSTGERRVKEVTFQLDKGSEQKATPSADGTFTVDAAVLPAGLHQIVAEVVDDRGTTHVRCAYFRTGEEAADPSKPRITREFPLKSGSQSSPALDGNLLFVGANDGILRAIDLSSGATLWEQNLNCEIISSPVVSGDRLVVGSNDKSVYCFDKMTGRQLWKFETGNAVMASPLVADGTVFVGSGDFNLYAISLADGGVKWKFPAQKLIKAIPAFAGGKLFFGAWDNNFYCVDAQTGQLAWKVPASISAHFSAATSNPATTGSRVLVTSHDYSVRCLDQNSGSHVWMYKPAKEELGPSYSSFVFRENIAYTGSINGHVVGFDVDSGAKVFDVNVRPDKTDALFDSAPVIDRDRLYVGSVGGNLYCVDIPGRKVAWSVALQPGFIFTKPVVWKDRVLVASMADKVFEIAVPVSVPEKPAAEPSKPRKAKRAKAAASGR